MYQKSLDRKVHVPGPPFLNPPLFRNNDAEVYTSYIKTFSQKTTLKDRMTVDGT